MSRSILILGAGLMQRPAILAAKELGYRAVIADANPCAPCVSLADYFAPVDLKDRDALVRLADEVNARGDLAAVFTAGTDFSASVAYVAEHCGLAGHSYEAALNASDKVRMRVCFSQAGVPSPAFVEVTGAQVASLADAAERGLLELPKVVKPCDNMGGRGCRLVRTSGEFLPAVQEALRASRTGRAILEDYMDGTEYSIDAIVCGGTLTVTGFADRHIQYPPYFIEMGHTLPSAASDRVKHELVSTFALGVRALGLRHGVAKADIKYTKRGAMIGEIAARLSGGYMSGWTYPYASGVALTTLALRVALGEEPCELIERRVPLPYTPPESCAGATPPFSLFELPCERVSAERAWVSIPGTIRVVHGLDGETSGGESRYNAFGFVRDVLPRVGVGDTVRFPRNNVEKCGNVIACAPTREEAVRAAQMVTSAVTLRLAPCDDATDAFLAGRIAQDEGAFPPPAFPAALTAYEAAHDADAASETACVAIIPAASPIGPLLPACLAPFLAECDWNQLPLAAAVARFDALCPRHGVLPADQFWRALLRGSVQGALYVADRAACSANDDVLAATT